jgi:addiction module RelE/StbE family toxin
MKVRWSASAREDLKEIGRYIARDNPRAARRWVEHLRRRARQAGDMPRAGRIVPELERDDIREIIEGNYRIVYLIGRFSVDILAVREGHRRLVIA